MPSVRYLDVLDRKVEFAGANQSLLEISLAAGLPHFHQCNATARCTTCRVEVREGLENLPPRSGAEAQIATERGWSEAIRLACQARPRGDITVARIVLEEQAARAIYPEAAEAQAAEERMLAVMFCDLRNFTGFAADHLPHDVVYVLNRYFREVCEPVLENDGYIDKYLGDGFLAVFGLQKTDPAEFCLDALRAAARIPGRVRALNLWLQGAFGLAFDFGVGLHFGPAVVGQTGHPLKMQLTVLGDTVNIASRTEGRSRRAESRILATSAFRAQVGDVIPPVRTHRLKLTRAGRWDVLGEIRPERLRDGVLLVQMSFDEIAADRMAFADAFYERLFARGPRLRGLFAQTDMPALKQSFVDMLGRVVRRLHRFDEMAPVLRELGARHAGYGVKPEYYAVAAEALMEALAARLGERLTAEMQAAWRDALGRIAGEMTAAGAFGVEGGVINGDSPGHGRR